MVYLKANPDTMTFPAPTPGQVWGTGTTGHLGRLVMDALLEHGVPAEECAARLRRRVTRGVVTQG